jgi:hypothetical protein
MLCDLPTVQQAAIADCLSFDPFAFNQNGLATSEIDVGGRQVGRHREAAERTALTAISTGARPAALADLLFAAETDRVFADSGHSLDFINKAFECLDLIGWQHAADVLPTVIGQMVAARGADESAEWRQPADLIVLCEKAATDLPAFFAVGRDRGPWLEHAELAQDLLGDDPSAIIRALEGSPGR